MNEACDKGEKGMPGPTSHTFFEMNEGREDIKTTYPGGSTYTISVNAEDLDRAITKMNELVALLNKANELAILFSGNLEHVEGKKRNVQKQ